MTEYADDLRTWQSTSVGGRPRQTTDREILNAAIAYCEIGGRDAVKATARHLGENRRKVSRLLALARDAGWLSKPGKGRAGGVILPPGWHRWNELSNEED